MLSEERSMEIMVVMNKLALELLPLVPDFALNEMQEISVGTHRVCIKQVVAATQSRACFCVRIACVYSHAMAMF
jgi:hypothetical protein